MSKELIEISDLKQRLDDLSDRFKALGSYL